MVGVAQEGSKILRHTFVILLFGLSCGCREETTGLPDGGLRDAAFPMDSAAPDAVVARACPFPDTSSTAAPICGRSDCMRRQCLVCDGKPEPLRDAGFDGSCVVLQECSHFSDYNCLQHGYLDIPGFPRCEAWCDVEPGSCQGCAGCIEAEVGTTHLRDVSIKALGERVGVAWVDERDVRFLTLERHFPPTDSVCLGLREARRVALAATPLGWVFAVEMPREGIRLLRLEADAALTVKPVAVEGSLPVFADREASPLLVWTSAEQVVRAALVDADLEFGWEVELFAGASRESFATVANPGDSFAVAASTARGVQAARVGMDGTIRATALFSAGPPTFVDLARVGERIVLAIFRQADQGPEESRTEFLILDPSLRVLAVTDFRRPPYLSPVRMAALGDELFVLRRNWWGNGPFAIEDDPHLIINRFLVRGLKMEHELLDKPNRDPHPAKEWRLIATPSRIYSAWITHGFPGRLAIGLVAE